MSTIENMLHRQLPAWEPAAIVTNREFYTFIGLVVLFGVGCLVGFHRWL